MNNKLSDSTDESARDLPESDVYDAITSGLETLSKESDQNKFIAEEMQRLVDEGVPIGTVLNDVSLVIFDRFLPGSKEQINACSPDYICGQALAAIMTFAEIEKRRLEIKDRQI